MHKRMFCAQSSSLKKFVRPILFLSTVKLVEEETPDQSVFPALTFDDVGQYAKEKSGCNSTPTLLSSPPD